VLLTTRDLFDGDAIGAESGHWLQLDTLWILFILQGWINCLKQAQAKLTVEITAPTEEVCR
jgi:hypothetical protein